MNNNISFNQYKGIDIAIMTVLTVVAEAVVTLAASSWFPNELYSLSPMAAMVCIVMMRWGAWAAVPAVASGIAFCAVTDGSLAQYAVYVVGNCFSLVALVWFKAMGKEAVRKRIEVCILYALTAFAGTILGRWGMALLFGDEPNSIVSFFLVDCLSMLFAVVVTLISRKIDGLFEDQKSYLIRTAEEREKEREEKQADNSDYND